MRGTIPIRRVGGILPTLCLVGIVLLLAILTWLTEVGLPESMLRDIEAQAARQGMELHLGAVRLAPTAGTAVRLDDVRVILPQEDAKPAQIEARKICIEFSLSKLLSGNYLPERVHIPEAKVIFPPDKDEAHAPLHLDKLNVQANVDEGENVLRLTLRGMLNGIGLDGRAKLPLEHIRESLATQTTESESQAPLAAVQPILPTLCRVRDEIERQHWTEAESPHLELRADLTGDTPHITAKANVPRWEQEPFRFLDITLDTVFRDNTLLINQGRFRTESPEADMTLQGGYDLTKREADFRLTSTAAVINMVQKLVPEEDIPELLKRLDISPEHAPRIELAGHVSLTEDNEIEDISMEGELHQDGFLFGKTEISQTDISFYFDNGNLNIDKLQFRLPEGAFTATALLRDGKGTADLKADIPTPVLLQLAQDTELLTAEECAELGLSGMNTLALNADFTAPVFVPGKTRFEEFVPSLQGMKAHLELGQVTQDGLTLVNPWLDVSLEGVAHDAEHAQADKLTLTLTLPRTTYAQGDMSSEEREGALTLTVNDLHVDSDSFRAQAAELTASLKSHAASIGEQHASADGMALSAHLGELNIPFSGDDAPSIGSANAEFRCDASAMEEQKLTGLKITLRDLRGLVLDLKTTQPLQSGTLHVSLATLNSGDALRAEETEATLTLSENKAALLEISGYLNDKPWQARGAAQLHEDGTTLLVDSLYLSLPAAELEPLLEAAGCTTPEVKIPEEVALTLSHAEIDLTTLQPKQATIDLRLPELVRCPQQPVLQGKDVTISAVIHADVRTTADENILFSGSAEISHETGKLQCTVDGDLRNIRIQGESSIHGDVIDLLVDDPDVHYVLRDYRFIRGVSEMQVRNIDVAIDLTNGLNVLSHCDAEMRHVGYLCMSMTDEEDDEGNILSEKLRTDLGTDEPHTMAVLAACGVDTEVRMNRKDAQGRPIKDVIRIDLTHPELRHDNRPWLARQGISGGKEETTLKGRLVSIDIENSFVTLYDTEGACYPAYAFGMFYPDLQLILKDVRLARPITVSSATCTFPIASDCQKPMVGTIRGICHSGASVSMVGPTIPMEKYSGFVTISDTEVGLRDMNALVWEGVVNADIQVNFAKDKVGYEGYIKAENLNLREIAAACDATLSPALVSADCRFTCPDGDLNSLRAYGRFDISDGNLMELKLFNPLAELIADLPNYLVKFESAVSPRGEAYKPNWVLRQLGKAFSATGSTVDTVGGHITNTAESVPFANHLISYDIQDASGTYRIANGHFITENAKVRGNNLKVRLNLDIDMDTLDLKGNLWPTISGVPSLLISPLTFVSDYMIDINLYGNLNHIKWKFSLDGNLRKRGSAPSVESEERRHGE